MGHQDAVAHAVRPPTPEMLRPPNVPGCVGLAVTWKFATAVAPTLARLARPRGGGDAVNPGMRGTRVYLRSPSGGRDKQ